MQQVPEGLSVKLLVPDLAQCRDDVINILYVLNEQHPAVGGGSGQGWGVCLVMASLHM